jgi:hypothetical protein
MNKTTDRTRRTLLTLLAAGALTAGACGSTPEPEVVGVGSELATATPEPTLFEEAVALVPTTPQPETTTEDLGDWMRKQISPPLPNPLTTAPSVKPVMAKVTPATTTATTTAQPVVIPAEPVVEPTTTTTAAPSATTTTMAEPAASCTVVAAQPTASKGSQQTVTLTSNMPANRFRLDIQYPQFGTGKPNPRQTFELTTDDAGAFTHEFPVLASSTVPAPVRVQFWNAEGHLVPGCATTFEAV